MSNKKRQHGQDQSGSAVQDPPTRATDSANLTPADALAPRRETGVKAPAHHFHYWCGIIDIDPKAFPLFDLHIGNWTFSRTNHRFVTASDGSNDMVPSQVVGSMMQVTRADIEKLLDLLPRTVIRFQKVRRGVADSDTLQQFRTRAYPITIPTEAELAERRKNGHPANDYVAQPDDRPASEFIYAVPGNSRGAAPAPPLSETGFQWPEGLSPTAQD